MPLCQDPRLPRWTARLMLGAFVLTLPGFGAFQAVAANVEGRAAVHALPQALPVLPVLRTAALAQPNLLPYPTLPAETAAQTGVAIPQTALTAAVLTAQLPPLNGPEAPASAISAEAARAFDGGWLRAAAPKLVLASAAIGAAFLAHHTGDLSWTAGMLPLLAGTLRDRASGPAQAAKDEQFLGAAFSVRKPGEMLGPNDAADIGARLGQSPDESVKTVARLAKQGRFALLADGYALAVDLPPADPEEAPAAEGRAAAVKAVALLNGGKPEDALRALALLQKAYMKFPRDDEPEAEESRRQIAYLRLNASLQVLRGAVAEAEAAASGPTERSLLKEAKDYLATAYYDPHHVPYRPTQEAHELILDAVKRYPLKVLAGQADAKDLEAGLALAKLMAKKLAPDGPDLSPAAAQSGGGPLLLPAPASSKSAFDLIPETDNRFKSLHKFGTNLTGLAAAGKLKPLVGRRKELRQVIKVLLRDEKNNPIVVGEAGVGKTQLVEGLAQEIVAGKAPEELKDKNIFKLNLNALIAGTTLRGEFEERVQKVLNEVAEARGRVILFIDEVHMVLGLGSSEGSHDLSQMLLDAMARGGVSIIGATTLDKYRKIENSAALNRRFQGVTLSPNTREESLEILRARKGRYEKKHRVTIPEETLKAAVDYAARYITDRQPPDSALDLLDDAATEVQLTAEEAEAAGQSHERTLTPDDVAREIALRMEIPVQNVSATDKEMLKAMPERLKRRVVGQDEAIKALTRAVRKSRLGYKDPNRPDVYLFLGPTGVGKTELAKALAELLFGSDSQMTPIDMSEYGEKHNVARLISAPPGYVGHENGGQLTEPVRRKPRQIILLDEIDKAHAEVYNILLQMAEEGRLTDGQGRRVNFKDTVIIITANFEGSHSATERRPMGFSVGPEPSKTRKAESQREKYLASLEGRMRPELINRIGKQRIIVLNELTPEVLAEIARIREADLNRRLQAKRMTFRLTDAAVRRMVDDASSPKNLRYGARPLRDIIEEEILNAAADAELEGLISNGDRVIVDYDADKGWVVAADKSAK